MMQDLADFIMPSLGLLTSGQAPKGDYRGRTRYNSAASLANDTLANGYLGYIISQKDPWFGLRMAYDKLNDLPGVPAWLEEGTRYFYYLLQDSNFYADMGQFVPIGTSIGTSATHAEEDRKTGKIVFSTRHPRGVFVAEDAFGRVDTLYYEQYMSWKGLIEQFGRESLSAERLEQANSHPFDEQLVINAIEPRSIRETDQADSRNMPWRSAWILPGASEKNEPATMLRESGYRIFPELVWRYRKNADETYGRSPGADALAEILGLNTITRDNIDAQHRAVDPALDIPKERRGIRLDPGSKNYYEQAQREVRVIHTVESVPIGIDREQRMERIIEQHYHTDIFRMLSSMEKGPYTAYEIAQRQGEKAALMGPQVARFSVEVLNSMFDRLFQIELEAGRFPPIPASLRDYPQAQIDIQYIGPLAQLQTQMFRTAGLRTALAALMPVLELRPEVADNFDWDGLARELAVQNGLPQKIVKDIQDVAKIRDTRQRMQAAQMQMANLQALSKSVPGLSQAVQPGSLLDAAAKGAVRA